MDNQLKKKKTFASANSYKTIYAILIYDYELI